MPQKTILKMGLKYQNYISIFPGYSSFRHTQYHTTGRSPEGRGTCSVNVENMGSDFDPFGMSMIPFSLQNLISGWVDFSNVSKICPKL